jgi:hypothetical protein
MGPEGKVVMGTTQHFPGDGSLCESFLPGHKLHWSLYKKASGARTVMVSHVIVTGTALELVIPGEPSIRWVHHDPQRVAAAIKDSVDPILACPEWRALRIDGYWFNCAEQGADLSVCG